MKKRVLAVLMALSLVSSSAVSDFGSITVSAEAVSDEPVAEETDDVSNVTDNESEENASDAVNETERSEETPSDNETASSDEQIEETQSSSETTSTTEQSEETQSSSETSSSSAESTASSEDSPEEENHVSEEPVTEQTEQTEQNNENIDESEADSNNAGTEDSVPSETQGANSDANNEEESSDGSEVTSEDFEGARTIKDASNDESNYIVKTTCVNGTYYNVDSDWKLTVWGENIEYKSIPSDIREKAISIDLSGKIKDASYLFAYFYKVQNINIHDVDTSNNSSMYSMFQSCHSLRSIDLSEFNTENVKDMSNLFRGCTLLSDLDLSSFDTSNVTDMSEMFWHCTGLVSVNLSSFDTSNVTNMEGMFEECNILTKAEVNCFKTSNVKNMSRMFYGCKSLTRLDLSSFNTAKVTDMSCMFSGCEVLTDLNLSGFITDKVTSMQDMFSGCNLLAHLDVTGFYTPKLKDMEGMFANCTSLTELDLSSFNTAKVSRMFSVFSGCSSLISIDLSSFNTSKVLYWDDMFNNCSSLTKLDLSNFDMSCADTSVNGFLYNCSSLEEFISPQHVKKTIALPGEYYIDANDDGILDTEHKTTVISISDRVIRYVKVGGTQVFSTYMETDGKLVHESEEKGGTGNIYLRINKKEFLESSSLEYNHEIAKFACALSTMAYSEKTETIKQMFKDLGYTADRDGDLVYFEDTNGKEATYWIGNVQLNEDNVLVTILVRGTYLEEWYDNFEPGRGTVHEGFDRGATSVVLALTSYLTAHNNFAGKNVKILVTGHSRGAAVANLIGQKLDTMTFNNFPISRDNTFIYTFATPNVSKENSYRRSELTNIYNIVNPEDFVTKVLPGSWGYGRYGISLVLPSKSNTNEEDYNFYLDCLRAEWWNYFKNGYNNQYEPYADGMQDVTNYVETVGNKVWDVTQYYDKKITFTWIKLTLHNLYHDTLASFMAKNYAGGSICFVDALGGGYGILGCKTAAFFLTHQALKLGIFEWDHHFEYAHQPETYLAAMNIITKEELLRPKKMLKGIINCPVDITITNDAGDVVGVISDNTVVKSDESVSMNVDGDSKSFIIPADSDYNVTLTGNDNGVMDYSVCEYDCDTLEGDRIYYHEIPLNKGTTYEMIVTGDASLTSLELKDNRGSTIANQVISEEESGKLTVDVDVVGNGSAEGFGNLTPGDYVTLSAVAEEGNTFEGWYDESGNLISSEAEYGFSISQSLKIIAKFSENPNENPSSGENTQGENGENAQPQVDNNPTNNEQPQNPTENRENGTAHPENNQTNNGQQQTPTANANDTNTQPVEDNGGSSDTVQPVENGNNSSAPAVKESGDNAKASVAVGTEFTSAGKVYRVNGENTVTFIKPEDKKAKTISVPSNVVYENQTYSVTEVNAKACKGMKKLKSVTIPSSVTKIGSKAFYNCPNLKKVTVKANSSLTVGKSSFKKVNKDCNIKVKGLKKKAKTSMIEKIKKQTNGKVK